VARAVLDWGSDHPVHTGQPDVFGLPALHTFVLQ